MTKYDHIALKEPVIVGSKKAEMLLKTETKSIMAARLKEMKAGNGISLDNFEAISV